MEHVVRDVGGLTQREIAIVRCLLAGKRNKEIAVLLHIALPTVKSHVRNIQQKLQAANRVHVVSIVAEMGLFERFVKA